MLIDPSRSEYRIIFLHRKHHRIEEDMERGFSLHICICGHDGQREFTTYYITRFLTVSVEHDAWFDAY